MEAEQAIAELRAAHDSLVTRCNQMEQITLAQAQRLAALESAGWEQRVTMVEGAVQQATVDAAKAMAMGGHGGGGRGGHGGNKDGIIQAKNMIPDVFKSDLAGWSTWKDDVEMYVEVVSPELKTGMDEILRRKTPITKEFIAAKGEEWAKGSRELWALLKNKTQGEARKLVCSGDTGNGLDAWRRLAAYFEPNLEVKQAQLLAEYSGMIAKPARNTKELKGLLVEMDQKRKLLMEVAETAPNDMHAKSISLGS